MIGIAWALPAVFGADRFTLIAVMLLSGLGNAFAGESVYKVWTQEPLPTLLHAHATGVTTAFTRAVAGLAALVTPVFALGHPGSSSACCSDHAARGGDRPGLGASAADGSRFRAEARVNGGALAARRRLPTEPTASAA